MSKEKNEKAYKANRTKAGILSVLLALVLSAGMVLASVDTYVFAAASGETSEQNETSVTTTTPDDVTGKTDSEATVTTATDDTVADNDADLTGKEDTDTGNDYTVTGKTDPVPSVNAATRSTASVPAVKAVTTITGYKTSINRRRKAEVKVNATIRPANGGRTVRLQRYDSATGKWYAICKTVTEDADQASVEFSIPSEERQKTTSLWRIRVAASNTAQSAKSSTITLTTRNIRTYRTSAKAACIYRIDDNGKGKLIYSKSYNKELAQASTTKLMTAILLLESGLLNTRTRISQHAADTPWASGRLTAGDYYNTEDLLYAMLLPSSNDAATAVAERVGGSEEAFVAMMNNKAQAMKLNHTHFRNPHGLDADGHYTTALELAKLTAYAYTFPEIRTCWATQTKRITSLRLKKSWTLWSTNAIFQYVKNFLGGKTGTEDNAGCCFTGVYKYKGSTYVTVVLGSGYGFSRWSDTQVLHKYIRNYAATAY